ncbi:T9SS type B sorting domain-containing protein [Flavobacterium adhaerens]|uniref:T9SS type B sorting domain-containing protein n=1 Tax=Flavobacterium adhaerens TaxID=3149043 RepID=UPI0032B3E058
MKKSTFSNLIYWLLSLFENAFQTFLFDLISKEKKLCSLRVIPSQTIRFPKPSSRTFVLLLFFILQSFVVLGQKDFTPRFDSSLKGDMLLIGNNIVNRKENSDGPNVSYNGTKNNNDLNMQYVDIDSDGSTFSSSSATLKIPTASQECYKIVYAGLYWSGIYKKSDADNGTVKRSELGKVKFKLANQNNYNDLTGDLIYDYHPSTTNGDQIPYVYYKDVTSMIEGLSNPEGSYTVANITSSVGQLSNGGFCAGWSLFVVYEDPKSTAKYITSFDGLSWIQANTNPVTYKVSGFKTIPTGVVKAKLAFASLEGDFGTTKDKYTINNYDISTNERKVDNFFNSTINDVSGPYTDRSPNSSNTLGYDSGIINLDNSKNTIIKNNETEATLKLSTGGDGYGLFFNAFNVEIIEPKIVLTKIVKNTDGVDIGNQNVTLGQILNYEIGLQNVGNDHATSLTIRDILPINTIFNYPADASSVSLPPGVSINSYNAATREIVFNVNNSIVEIGDGISIIRLKVQVVPSCNMLSDACSNSIDNQAYATYKGTVNTTFTISDDPSINTSTGCILVPKATNFLVGIDDCEFTKSEVLCGNSVVISAANGYESYKWSTAPFDNNGNTSGTIIGNSQTLTVTNPGIYYVYNTAVAPCLSITEAVTVSRYGGVVNNPVIPFANEVVTCPNDGKLLPNIFLCGANATKEIITNISDGSTIIWEKLNEGSCAAVTNPNCANEADSCTWDVVGTGANYIANTSGQFRLTMTYPGNCFNRFYFNVYQNLLDPTETHKDIICTTPGNITVGNVPTDYEYSISNVGGTTPTTYGPSNSFAITTEGLYTVFIRQVGVTNGCVFSIPNIQIRKRNFTVTSSITHPVCFGEKGSIKVIANDGYPSYNYYIYDGGTLVNSVGPITESDYTFTDLTPAKTYQVRVTTADGCDVSNYPYIDGVYNALTATAAIVAPLTSCSDGKIVIRAQGGTSPYYYFINGSTTFQTSNEIIVTTPGQYDIEVVDSKNCSQITSVTIPNNDKPTYTIDSTSATCYGSGSEIRIENVVANGHSMSYSINNGGTFVTNPTFSNLSPGTYNVVVRYGITYTSQNNNQETIYCQDPAVPVIITGASSAVTASAGVGELAGCGALINGQPSGLLRITNVEGGTPGYQYSFDGQQTWENVSEKYVVAGTYNLAVRDSQGCIFQIPYPVVLDPKPADPSISDNVNTVYNCDGSATATVTVTPPTSTGGASYTYEYYIQLNGTGAFVPNSPIGNNVFTNVPTGNHNIKVTYNVQTVSSFSNLLQEDFGRGGDTSSPGINPAYCREDQDGNTMAFATCALSDWHPWLMNDGDYVVTKGLLADHYNDFRWWLPKDHTAEMNGTSATITDGRFLAVNIGATIPLGAVLYSKPINDVLPNQEINVSLYMTNLLRTSNNLPSPKLRVQLVKNGTVIATVAMPDIPRDEKWHFSTTLTGSLLTLNPGPNTDLEFQILSDSQVVSGNDLAIDDIHVYQIPKSCGNEKVIPFAITSGNEFKASIPRFTNVTCNGASDGTITILAENFDTTAGYEYNVDGGAFIPTTDSELVITGLNAGSHTIIVRNDATGSCSYTLTQAITAPTAVTVTAQVTSPATCTTGATITAEADGGTPAYEYELRAADGITAIAGYEFPHDATFINVPVGNYTVFARDANSCISAVGAPVEVIAAPTLAATLDASSDLCFDATNEATLIVNATGGSGTFSYQLDAQTPQPDNTFTNVTSGTHTITVTDTNNCTATISNIIIAPALIANTPVVTGLLCDPATDATITIGLSGGTQPYSYTVNGVGPTTLASGVTSITYSTATANTYNFTITDATGCSTTASAIVNAITNPTVTATPTQVGCNGATNGQVTLAGAGGSGDYTYSFNNSAFTTTTVYTGLSAGIAYPYQVKDSNGCTESGTITLTQPSALTTTASATALSCNTSNVKQTALVTVVPPTTGTSPYQYSFNGSTPNGTNTYTVTDNGTNQTINIVVTDANGCTFNTSVVVNGLNPPTDLAFVAAAITCNAPQTTLTATATNGVAPLTFAITSPAGAVTSNTTGIFPGLAPDTYNFRVTDANGCYYEEAHTINAVTPIAVAGNVVSNVLCNGGATGAITYTVSGNATVGNYTFAITPNTGTAVKTDNTITVTGLTAGSYTINVVDSATGCNAGTSAPITISQPAVLGLTATATKVNCNRFTSQITGTATGGTAGYTYAAVRTGQPAPAATAYAANPIVVDTNSGANLVWDVWAKDANGCTAMTTVTIIYDNQPTVIADLNNQCTATSNSTFTITATGTGGVAPLEYSIDGTSFQTSNVFNNLVSRTAPYVVTVKDANGCTATAAAIIVYPRLTANAQTTKELDCTATPNATITTTITGGRAPYSYTVTKGAGSPSAPTTGVAGPTFTHTVLVANADTYTFTITDANGCQTTAQATVIARTNPAVAVASQVNVSCNGGTNGSVTLTGSGGSGSNYTYSRDNITFVAGATFSALTAGTYTFYVKDGKGCVGSIPVTITQPTALTTTASATPLSCNTSNVKQTALVTVVPPTTGTSPYTYTFNGTSNGTNTYTVTDNGTNQTINIVVTDANGCPFNTSVVVNGLNPPTDLAFVAAAITCNAPQTTLTVTATNGVAPLTFAITSPVGVVTSNTTGVFTGLAPDTYNFRVTDANGCYYEEAYTINAVTPIAVAGNVVSDVLCNGGATGAITYTVSGNATVGNYTFTITPNTGTAVKTDNTITVTGLTAGTYTINVLDSATGCTATTPASITINQPAVLGLTATATNVNCNRFTSQITGIATGGTAGYTYAAVRTGQPAPAATAYAANPIVVDTNSGANLVWDVWAKDANGCTAMTTVTIIYDNQPTVIADLNNQCTATSNSTFTITATGTGGVAPLHYSIDGNDFTNTTGIFTVSSRTAPYVITVRDANGCKATAAAITVYPILTANAQTTKELDCTATPNATITTTITGGRAPYSYTVTKGAGTPSAPTTGVAGPTFTHTVLVANADTYTFTITDANGCQTTAQATVIARTNPAVAVASQVNVSCNGGTNGSVTLTGSGGSGSNYTYSRDNITFVAGATFTGLAQGTHTFYVKDGKGCVGQVDATITQPAAVTASIAQTTLTCSTTNQPQTATITVTAGGGTGTYTYSFDNGSSFGPSNIKTVVNTGSSQTFQIIVKDANGCTSVAQAAIIAPLNPPVIASIVPTTITCNATTSSATITVTGGVGTLNYQMTSPSVVNNGTNNVFAGLVENVNYTFRVTDANGCYDTEILRINPATRVAVAKLILSNVDCFGGTNGSARFTVTNNVGVITATLTNSLGNPVTFTSNTGGIFTYTGLVADTYTFIVTDAGTGCSATDSVTITQPTAALGASYVAVNANCNVTTSRVTVTTTGGTPSYSYSFVTSATTPGTYTNNNIANLNPTTSLTWYAHIKDAKGCTFVLPITIASDPVPTVSASAVNQCLGSGSYTITATNTTVGAIVTPITYSINNGASWQAGNTFPVTTAGNYVIKMKDGNGCIATSNTVTVNPQLTLSAVLNKGITCNAPADAQFTLTAIGGNPGAKTYEYSIDAGTTWLPMASNVLNTSVVGSYVFRVTDLSTCTAVTTLPLSITAPVNPDITSVTQTQFIGCHGDNSAAINVVYNPALGQAPFVVNVQQYSDAAHTLLVQDFGTQTSGLPAGYYVVTVTDAKGCFDEEFITITQPDPIVVDYDVDPITCAAGGVSLGRIIVNSVTGGTPNYTYHVTGVNGYNQQIPNQPGNLQVFDIVDFGLYQLIVTDANGCTKLIQDILVASPPDDLDITVTPPPADCSTSGSAVVAIGASSSITGVGPFHFAVYTPGLTYTAPTALPWYDEDSPGSKSATIPNLIPGVTYTFVVHDGLTGCYYYETAEFPIPTNSTITVSSLTANNITCKGSADGNVTFTLNQLYGVDTPVTYQIFDSQSTTAISTAVATTIPASGSLTISNFGSLPFGNYFVLVTETAGATHAGCSIATAPFNITESAIDLSVSAIVSKNANCNPNSGVISAIAKDGTAPYTYQILLATDPAPIATDLAWASTSTFNKDAGNYIVYAKDAYGCIKPFAVTLNADDAPTVTAPAPICYDGTSFTITFSGTVDTDIIGGATYSVNGSAFQATPSFTFNAAGTYNLVIKDGNGCTADVDYFVYPQLELKADLTKELDCTTSPAAEITLTATGGNPAGTYTYEYSTTGIGGPYVTMGSNVHTTSATGNYVFRVTNNNNTVSTTDDCQATTPITLDPIPVPTITANPIAVLCAGDSNGSVTINVTGGVGPYMYSLDGSSFQPENEFTGLAAGTAYMVTVRDAKMCTYTEPFTIGTPLALDATASVTTELTCTTGNATTKAIVTVAVTTGTGTAPYEYSFDAGANYSSENTFETYTAGLVAAKVKDANGCIFDVSTTVIALDPPTEMDITGTPIYCMPVASQTSTVTINSVTDGVGAFTYENLTTGISNTTGIFSGLTPGDYTFQVTDANGCTYQELYTVNDVTAITVSGQVTADVSCFGLTNGTAEFTVGNFTGTYSYTINGGTPVTAQTATTIPLTGLAIGNQVIVVTDETTGCTATATVTIDQPALALSVVGSQIQAANCNYGARVTATVTGGTPNYTYAYALTTGGTPAAGDYTASADAVLDATLGLNWTVYVKDANDCTTQHDFAITIDALPTIDSAVGLYCYTGAPVNIIITGTYVGTPEFSIGNGYQSTPNFTLNAPGDYTFYIKDGNGCVVSTTYTLKQQLLLQATLTQDLTCDVNATMTVLATQGTTPYGAYEVSFNGGTYTPIVGSTYTTSIAGDYQFKVTDAQGCEALSNIVTVTPTTTPDFTTSHINVSCPGGSDGTITVSAANGIAPYTYSIDGGAFQADNYFANLAAGTYAIAIKDAKGCPSASVDVTIDQPTALLASIAVTTPLTCGTANAATQAEVTVTVDATTGTAPYQYSFDGINYSSNNVYKTFTAETVTAYVRDANGCPFVGTLTTTIDDLNPPVIDTVTGTDLWCSAGNTQSTVTVATSSGIGSLAFEIVEPASAVGNTTGATSGIFTGLDADTYLFRVTDANGCTDEAYYTVEPLVNITVSGQVTADVSCFGLTNGTAEFTVGNFTGTYSYTINGGTAVTGQTAATIPLTGLAIGNQVIVVTDETTGCTATATVIIDQPALALSVFGSQIQAANCNYGARVTATVTGGTPNYTYAYALTTAGAPAAGDYTASADAVLDATLGLNWTVYVKDANDCTTQHDFAITIDALPTINSSAGLYCYTGAPVNITITGTYVGTPEFSIGNGYQSSPNFTLNAPGDYTFYIKDGNGCVVSTTYTLKQQLLLQATLTQDLTCDVDATIDVLATQGTTPYGAYEVSFNGGTFTAITGNTHTVNVAGDYQFRVTDAQGCEAFSNVVTVTPTTTPDFTTSHINVSCPGGSDGTITITAANGIAPYTYSINGGAFQTDNYFANLVAGTYAIAIKDAKGCPSISVDVTIGQPTALVASIAVTTPLTCGTANVATQAEVTVTVDATTGTAPYQYSFDGINYSSNNVYKTFTAETVTAYVRDANGCPFVGTLTTTIDALNPPVIDTVTGTDLWCSAGNTQSTVTVATSSGIGSLAFEIVEPATAVGNTTGATSGIFTGLDADTYLFRVTDANGCTDEAYYTVEPLVNITVSGQEIKAVTCNAGANGTLEFKVANYTGTFSAVLSPLAGTQTISGDTVTITGLAAGSYTLNITDLVSGCIASAPATISEPAVLGLNPVSNINATCMTDAQVTVEAIGGTPTYLYAFKPVGQTPVATDYTANAYAVLDKTITNWIAYVKDNNDCEAQLPITIATDALPTGFTATLSSQCPSTSGTYEITVIDGTGVGPFQYSIGSGFQTSPTFTVSNAGSYDITIKDANGCEFTFPTLVTIVEPLVLATNITALPSCSFNDGSVEVSVTGGTGAGNYRFQLDGGAIVSADTHTFTGLSHGSHTIVVRDVVTGCTDTVVLDLIRATDITGLTVDKTDVTCNGGNDGTITASIDLSAPGVNDNPVYTYELTGTTLAGVPVVRAAQTLPVFTNLEAGDYTVKVVSGRLCEDQEDITITQPAPIVVNTPTVVQFGCTAGNDANHATITVDNVTGGSNVYTIYEFFNGTTSVQRGTSNVYIETNYTGGTYSVTVADDKGCIGSSTAPITINPFISLDEIVVTVNTPITCVADEAITVSVTTTGGTPAGLVYTLVDVNASTGVVGGIYPSQTNSTGVFLGLKVADYLITVTNPTTGCSLQQYHYVNEPNTFELKAVKTSDVICYGSNEGTVELTLVDTQAVPTDDAGAFSYVVTGPTPSTGTSATAGPLTLSGLTAGLYTVTATLTNNPQCPVTTTFTIEQPSAVLSVVETHTEITCTPGNDGSIQVSATGGWVGNYEYQLMRNGVEAVPYGSEFNFTDLTNGNYRVNVRDSKGCIAFVEVVLNNPTPITVTATPDVSLVACNGDKSVTITAVATNGQGSNYLYTLNYTSLSPVISSGPQSSGVFTGLGAGTYTITATDGWGCSGTSAVITINEPTKVEASLVKATSQTCLTQATLTLTASGGTAPYAYSADAGFASPIAMSGNSVTFAVPNGEFSFYVRDANGCVSIVSNGITNDPLEELDIVLKTENAVINCKDDVTGVIIAEANGGLGNYVYSLVDASGNAITVGLQSTPGNFTQLPAGIYYVRVDSGDCNKVEGPVNIIEPDTSLSAPYTTVPVTCNGNGDGKIIITASGGTGIIKYAIEPDMDKFLESGTFENLKPGLYDVLVQDENGCFILIEDIEVTEPTSIAADVIPGSIQQSVCSDTNEGAFSIAISGGVGPYTVSLDDINGTYSPVADPTQVDFTALSGGDHTVYIQDANTCTFELLVQLDPSVTLDPVASLNYDCVNDLPANKVTVTIDPSNNPADVVYSLDNSTVTQTSNEFTNLTPGDHFIMVQHANGCIAATEVFHIDQIDPLAITIDLGGLNEIVATVTGGSGVYTYSVNGEDIGSNNKYVYFRSGNYTVTVTDSNGCSASATKYFEFVDIEIPNVFTPDGSGTNDTWEPTNTTNYPDIEFVVYDRYGREVGRFGAGQSWDGKYKGAELPMGDYWYVLKLRHSKDDREFIGHFTLYR